MSEMALTRSASAAASSATPAVHRLRLPTMIAYGIGQVAEALKTVGFNVFLLFYYQQIVGLSGTLTSAALAISLIIDAFCDPLAGALSDRPKPQTPEPLLPPCPCLNCAYRFTARYPPLE